MKKLAVLITINILILFSLSSCNKDDTVIGSNNWQAQSGLQGNWKVDQIQILQAPSTGNASALMKSALIPFGLMSASHIGWANITFGLEKWNSIISNTNEDLNRIGFLNNNFGWAFSTLLYSYNSSLYKTSDGGNIWDRIYLNNVYFNDICFVDENKGWATGCTNNNQNGIFYTTNGGYNWNLKYSIINGSAHSVYFIDNNTGWASGIVNMSGAVFKTTDGGRYWNSQFITGTTILNYVKFLNNSFGYTFGNEYSSITVIKKTLDGGTTWSDISAPGISYVKSLQFVNDNSAFLLGSDNTSKQYLIRTDNGGSTWMTKDFPYYANAIYFINSQTGYAVGENGLIINTTNGGDSWDMQAGISNVSINDIFLVNSYSGFAVGSNGTMLKKSNDKDSTLWAINGKITNPIINGIIKSDNGLYNSYGRFYTNNSNICFNIIDFSGGMGNVNTGGGTYALTDKLSIRLNLENNEKWLITLRR
jgi:photosystem II stability/assembly factor-like uncharacterized protein